MAKIGKSIVKAKRQGGLYKISTVLIHPQHTGQGKDKKTGRKIPAHHLTRVTVKYGGSTITKMKPSGALSQNPFIAFYAKGGKSAPLKVTWKDNKGGSWSNSTKLN